MLSFRRNNPHSAGTGTVDIALRIHFHSIRHARRVITIHIDKNLSIGEGVVGPNVETHDRFLERVIYIEDLLAGRKGESVWTQKGFVQDLEVSVFQEKYSI